LDPLSLDALKEICAARGPFVTVFLPARHPGAASLPPAERLRAILREASAQLTQRRYLGSIDQLLKPLEELRDDATWHTGGSDSVVFVSPGTLRSAALATPVAERVIVASHPYVTPLLSGLFPVPEFYVLAIAKKLLRLGCWRDGQFSDTPLPAGIPASFEETLTLETPDHDLQSHSAGVQGGARFGTGSERDQVHDRLGHYFQIVDRGLTKVLNGRPLVIVGIAQELAVYRSVAQHSYLLVGKPTSPAHLSLRELGQHGEDAIRAKQQADAELALANLRETGRRDHVATGVRDVLEAAHEGRVQQLLIERNAENPGLLGPLFPVDDARIEGEQDLINAAVVETIRRHGEVLTLAPTQLGACPVAALLRFSRPAS
jgi:hypothetical protein